MKKHQSQTTMQKVEIPLYRPPRDLEEALMNKQQRWSEIAKELEHFRAKSNKMLPAVLCDM